MNMIYLSNAANGYAAQDDPERKLYNCLQEGYLSTVIKEFRAGHPRYSNKEQFYAPFMVQFTDRQRWIVYSTTSCRTDRIKGQQWDAGNLKALDSSIEAAFLVYPSGISAKEVKGFTSQNEKYESHAELSFIDEILSSTEFIKRIKEREDIAFREAANCEDPNASVSELGKAWDFKGRSFEKSLAEVLCDASNLARWKNNRLSAKDRLQKIFGDVMSAFGLEASRVKSIEATSEQSKIGLLPNGGQPKTDVLVNVTLDNKDILTFTISCKRTNSDKVSAHQYKADDFADVLDWENVGLRNALTAFQSVGTIGGLEPEERKILEAKLAPYVTKLCKWVLSGEGGSGDPKKQIAQYLAVYRPLDNRFAIHSVDDYIEKMLARPMKNFGTPFYWTFASGQRGHSIQLKMPILI